MDALDADWVLESGLYSMQTRAGGGLGSRDMLFSCCQLVVWFIPVVLEVGKAGSALLFEFLTSCSMILPRLDVRAFSVLRRGSLALVCSSSLFGVKLVAVAAILASVSVLCLYHSPE